MNGADAKRGDIVRNRTTDELGEVRGSSQFGTLSIYYPWRNATIQTERYALMLVRRKEDR